MRKTIKTLLAVLLSAVSVAGAKADGALELKEIDLIKTSFADWTETVLSDKQMTVTPVTVTTKKSKEEITFTLTGVSIYPNAGGKVSSMTDGYLCAMKQDSPNNATIETSAFKSVTTVSFFHRATGSNRGWGLQVKGDGDADWVTVFDVLTNSNGTQVDNIEVNRTNVQLRWFNLSNGNYAAMSNLIIRGNIEAAPRAFKGFEIDFSNCSALPACPEGVTSMEGTPRGDSHGLDNFKMEVPVDGPVAIYVGGCQYSNTKATVKVGEDVIGEIDVKTPGCYHNGGVAKWIYNVEAPAILTIIGAQYTPYIKMEPCDFVDNVTVEYYNQDSKRLGETIVSPSEPLTFAYTAADITVAEGYAFRGWFKANGEKFKEGTAPEADLKLYAKVSKIEVAELGASFNYKLNDPFFYAEDHECFNPQAGQFHDAQHGWDFVAGNVIEIPVAGMAYLQISNCRYSAEADIIVTDGAGKELKKIMAKVESDGATETVIYEGPATTLKINIGGTTYIHEINVYNVASIVEKSKSGYYEIASGDASALLLALMQVEDGDKIFLHDGLYDLGETVLTTISKNNVSLIGESMQGTIIRNAPDVKIEGIGTTATLVLTGNNTYLQDLTLLNELDYYKVSTGRAVALWDKGNNTICKNVALLSHQDTYYSNKIGAFKYFEGGTIHGTVDYICGDGTVYFNGVELYCEKRNATGSGSDAVTASNANEKDKGYVFESCVLKSECPTVSLGRSWNYAPQCVFLNTKIDFSAGVFSLKGNGIERWTLQGMNILPEKFGEYNTYGDLTSPAENKVTFTYNGATKDMNTILSAEEAAAYSMTNVLGEWDPTTSTAQVEVKDVALTGNKLSWTAAPDATAYAIVVDGKVIAIVPTTETSYNVAEEVNLAGVRAANAMGGFGVTLNSDGTAIENLTDEVAEPTVIFDLLGNKAVSVVPGRPYVIGGKVKVVK